MARQVETEILVLAPLTSEEQQRTFEVLERLKHHRAEMLAARKGKLFPSSGKLIDKLREERTRELP
jgi:hypothetical protein